MLCYLPPIIFEENRISVQNVPKLLICPLSKGCEGLLLISLRSLSFLCRLKLSMQAQTQANPIILPPPPPVQDFSYKKMFPCRLKSFFHQAKVCSAASCYLRLLRAMLSPTHHIRGKQDLSPKRAKASNLPFIQRL